MSKAASMTRKMKRAVKKAEKNTAVELEKVIHHYFPDFKGALNGVIDPRNPSYITYPKEVILYEVIYKNFCNICSMRDMEDKFNTEESIANIGRLTGNEKLEELPCFSTISEFLCRVDSRELEKIRTQMIKGLIKKRSFENAKFLGKAWQIIIDGTKLFKFKKRHCEHCLTRTHNKGTENEKTTYYHYVLEAKIVFGSGIVVSIASEFIENESSEISKQDCELNAFKRLATTLKKEFPRLPICISADSLYACGPVFEICKKNGWNYLIRFKEGAIPSIAEEFESLKGFDKNERTEYCYINDIVYNDKTVNVIEFKLSKTDNDGTIKKTTFTWITNLKITKTNAKKFIEAGRARWKIENEGFNTQKNWRYGITHPNSQDYNAMKCHYILTQLSDIILQIYTASMDSKLRFVKRTLKNISSDLLKCFTSLILTTEDILRIKKRTCIIIS